MKVRCVTFVPLQDLNEKYLTPGKIYKAYDANEYSFLIRDDADDELYIVWNGSSHGTFVKVED